MIYYLCAHLTCVNIRMRSTVLQKEAKANADRSRVGCFYNEIPTRLVSFYGI